MVADTNTPQPAQPESAQGKTPGKLNREVKGIVSAAGLVIRLTVVLVPLGFLGWAGFRRMRPVVKTIRRKRKPASGKKTKKEGVKREVKGMGNLFGRKGNDANQESQKAGA